MDAAQIATLMQAMNTLIGQIQQGQQENTAAINALTAATQAAANAPPNAGGGAPAPAQQQPGAFAMTPGQANAGNHIDYTTATGIKLWNEATAPLPNKFTADGVDVNQFSEAMLERANKSGWTNQIADIINIPDDGNVSRNLLTEYGRLTINNIKTYGSNYINTQSRQAQNDMQMYHCIKNSLTDAAEKSILSERDKYHNHNQPSGPLLYKLLMQKAIIDTIATESLFRENLTNLDSYMSSVKSDIKVFNEYVKLNYEGLRARGGKCDDIMIHLFKAYLAVSDKRFVRYMELKKINYDDGNPITPEELMALALNQYAIINKQELWNAKTPEEEQVIALAAQFNKLKDENLKLAKSLKKKNEKKNESKKDDKDKGKTKKKANTEGMAWRFVAPTEGAAKKKQVNGKDWFWCPYHKSWTRHNPEAKNPEDRCRLEPDKKIDKGTKPSQSAKGDKRSQALAAVISAYQSDSE